MADTHDTLTALFSDIADAIRAKTGGTADIVADAFPDAIGAIPTGGGLDARAEVHEVTVSGADTSITVSHSFGEEPSAAFLFRISGHPAATVETDTLLVAYGTRALGIWIKADGNKDYTSNNAGGSATAATAELHCTSGAFLAGGRYCVIVVR